MDNKEDLRIIKTRKNLFDGLIKMMSIKTFEDIRVSDICKTALTNRSTFYSHFSDKYELLSTLIKELENNLLESIIEKNESNDENYFMNIFETILGHIDDNLEIYSAIIKNNYNSVAYNMIVETVCKDFKNYVGNNKINYNTEVPIDFVILFYSSAITNICINYVKYPNKYTRNEIIENVKKLLPEDIK